MEGRVYSDFYRNTSEEIFMKTLMESSVGITAPTMEMLGFKNLSNNFRADSEELFKSWLNTGENQGHNPTSVVHNRSRQLSRMLTDQTGLPPSHQNGVPPQTKRSGESMTPPSISENGESDMNEHSVKNPPGKGLQASNLFLAKAWFNSSQPMTRSRSSELRRKYVAMQNSQTAIGIEAMQNVSGFATKDFVNPCAFKEASVCDIPNPFNDLMSTCNSSSSTFNAAPHTDKISSVVNMLKGTLERKKLANSIEKECYYSNSNQVHEIHISEAGGIFQDLTDTNINGSVLIQGLEGVINADLEGFVAPTNLIQMNVVSREPSQSESSAAAPVISTGFDVSDGPSYSGQSPSVCQSPRKQFENGKNTEIGVISKDIRGRMYNNLKDQKPKGSLSRHGSVTSFASGDKGDPTKKRRVERSRKMAEAKEKTLTPATSSDMQSILKRCENLEKEVRSLKLNLSFMNRKDSEQTKQIEDLQKQNEDMGEEKERLLEEIERILSQTR